MPSVGGTTYLNCQLFDGATNKFVRAYLFDAVGLPLVVNPQVNLSHIGNGLYTAQVPFPGGTPEIKASYSVFDDAGYTRISRKHSDAIDVFEITPPVIVINQEGLIGTLQDGSLVGLFVEPDSIVGQLVGGSLAGNFEHADTFVGQLLESNDDLIPGKNPSNDGIEGQILC